MSYFAKNIADRANDNDNFRQVLYTDHNMQIVLMSLNEGEDIGEEEHEVDQFIRIEYGEGKAVVDGDEFMVEEGMGILVPARTKHNIINTSSRAMKISTLYAPPQHRDGTIHRTKADAMADTSDEY